MICGTDMTEILHFSMDIFMFNNVKSSQSIWTSARGRNTIDNRRLGITQAQSCSILVAYTETGQWGWDEDSCSKIPAVRY